MAQSDAFNKALAGKQAKDENEARRASDEQAALEELFVELHSNSLSLPNAWPPDPAIFKSRAPCFEPSASFRSALDAVLFIPAVPSGKGTAVAASGSIL